MKKLFVLVFSLLGIVILTAQSDRYNINVNGVERSFLLHLPSDYVDGDVIPLVFNFHGFGSNAVQQEFYSGMNLTSDEEYFAVCYPEGIDNAWNVGWSINSDSDDVSFVEAMIDQLSDDFNIDQSKIYSCGMSNGGFFSYRLACELTDRIAAIASVTGAMLPASINSCEPSRKIPVMQIHGTDDATVFYNGTPFISAPIEDVVGFWVDENSCAAMGDTTFIDDINPNDGSTAIRIDYDDCEDDVAVAFYKIQDGAHTWPGASIDIGVTNRDFNASQEIWNFFAQYQLPSSTSTFDTKKDLLTVTPNPAAEYIEVQSSPNTQTVQKFNIINIQGQVIRSFQSFAKHDIQDLESGVYFIQTQDAAITKFVKI